MSFRILLIEDDPGLALTLSDLLTAEGYALESASDGETGLARASAELFDLVILDVMLPRKSGFDVCRELRQKGIDSAVLMLTAKTQVADCVAGLKLGADDYLTKPFELSILIARIGGLLRRREWLEGRMRNISEKPGPKDVFTFGDKSLHFDALELRVRDQVFRLTLMEANVLSYLVQHEGKPVSRKALLEDVWGLHEDTDTRAIDNFIVRLRRYIEDDPTKPRHLLTVRGVGYRFFSSPAKVKE